ncbi:endonuclease domain-containing protein [Bradyrhizobium oligotrophicum S58]
MLLGKARDRARRRVTRFRRAAGKDAKRDEFFAAEGFEVLRFTNAQVTSNLEGVVEAIRQALTDRARGLPPSPPVLHKGEGSGESCASGKNQTTDTSSSRTRRRRP